MNNETLFSADDLARIAETVARIHAIPGVPTTDWCERAHDAIAVTHGADDSLVGIATCDNTFQVRLDALHLEPGASQPNGRLRFGRPVAPALTDRLRRAFAAPSFTPSGGVVGPIADPDAAEGGPSAYLLGLTPVEEGSLTANGAWLVVELGLRSADPAAIGRAAARLSVTLEHIGPRFRLAFADAVSSASVGRVTPSEQVVLEQLVLGRSVKQIAEELSRSPHTIHDHIKSLHRKFGATNRGQLVARALGHSMSASG